MAILSPQSGMAWRPGLRSGVMDSFDEIATLVFTVGEAQPVTATNVAVMSANFRTFLITLHPGSISVSLSILEKARTVGSLSCNLLKGL